MAVPAVETSPPVWPGRTPITSSRVASRAAATRAMIGNSPGHGSTISDDPRSTTRTPRIAARESRADTASTAPPTVMAATTARARFTTVSGPDRGSRRRGRELQVVGCRDDLEIVDGPVAKPGPADHRADIDRTELA